LIKWKIIPQLFKNGWNMKKATKNCRCNYGINGIT
jgi:hypothetical protein